jgi:hypothetical protein
MGLDMFQFQNVDVFHLLFRKFLIEADAGFVDFGKESDDVLSMLCMGSEL